MSKHKKNSIQAGKELIQSIFGAVSICIVLIVINQMFSPGFFWAKYPILFILLGVFLNAFKFLGIKASERFEKKTIEKQIQHEEELELKELQEEMRRKNTPWEEDDLV